MCETCHDVPGYIVHHKTELNPHNIMDPEVTLDFKNLKYDCLECHNKEHGKDVVAGLAEYDFSPDGQIIPRQSPPRPSENSIFRHKISPFLSSCVIEN